MLLFALVVGVSLATNALAQAGSLRGQVTDQNGAIVVGAKVSARSSIGQTLTVTADKYSLSISMSIRNIINHTNPGPIIGNITSPVFGQANQPSDAGALDSRSPRITDGSNYRRGLRFE